jgi:hypothetical protein
VSATIPAASLNYADVQAALNLAQAGDTVLLPAGTGHWATGVSRNDVPANVTFMGAGTSATGGGDLTTIYDEVPGNNRLLQFATPATGAFRMTGITFRSGPLTEYKDAGTISFGGGQVRIDHCHFWMLSSGDYKLVTLGSGVFGVMDHCILELAGTNAIYPANGRFDSASGDFQGNGEWTRPTGFGTSDFFFIEDNIINGDVVSGPYSSRIYDGFTASRMVARFNTLSQCCVGESHATGHSFDDRGMRAQEAYGNLVTSSLAHEANYVAVDIKSGCSLVWGNSWHNVFKNIYLAKVTRGDNTTYNQSPTPNGWGYAGTGFNGVGSAWDFSAVTPTGYPSIDQTGRGQGDLLTGFFPSKVNATTGTIAWPNQALEPVYIWNNFGSIESVNGQVEYNIDESRILSGRDYYRQASGVQVSPTSPFNGTSGVGWGTLANRPTTCTAGVAYFATDQGSWNTSTSNPYGVQQNGADGVLYKATATNTWTLYYTPYTYPHPLQGVSGGGGNGGGGGGGSGPSRPPGSATYYSGNLLEGFANTYYSGTEDFIPE